LRDRLLALLWVGGLGRVAQGRFSCAGGVPVGLAGLVEWRKAGFLARVECRSQGDLVAMVVY